MILSGTCRLLKTGFYVFLFTILVYSNVSGQLIRQFDYHGFSFDNMHHTSLKNTYPQANPVSYSVNLELINIFALIMTGSTDHEPSFNRFKEAFTSPPVWDDDNWPINYVAHPLMGSETYLRAREAGWGRFGSFAFSTALSVLWEFVIESWTEPPSRQDLLVTSTAGSLLGEGRYWLKQKVDPEWYWLIDPLNMIYISFNRLKAAPEQRFVSIGTQVCF